ncbi:MAG: hypothetical protein HYV27_10535 [Candidatus Hydrogenedentes bacterium]|nr:hypothetical protein [Candidatus Hydrogenedentota bacterium]
MVTTDHIQTICASLQAPAPAPDEVSLLLDLATRQSALVALAPYKRNVFCAHALALSLDGMALFAYDNPETILPFSRYLERCAIPARTITLDMDQAQRQETAAAIQAGAVRILYAPVERLVEARFLDFLYASPLAMIALLGVSLESPQGRRGWEALRAHAVRTQRTIPCFWFVQDLPPGAAAEAATRLGIPQCPALPVPPSLDTFETRLAAGGDLCAMVHAEAIPEADACKRIAAFIRLAGITNPLKWVGSATYLSISQAAASAQSTDAAYVARLLDPPFPAVEIALVLACLENRDARRPQGSLPL